MVLQGDCYKCLGRVLGSPYSLLDIERRDDAQATKLTAESKSRTAVNLQHLSTIVRCLATS